MNSIKGAEPQIKNLIDRMKKNKEEHKNPMKIFSKEEEKNDDPEYTASTAVVASTVASTSTAVVSIKKKEKYDNPNN